MKKTSSSRPHLDHLRRQAKALLQDLASQDSAAHTLIAHLPAAQGMRVEQVRAAGFRLADAQSAIARREGFASWPALATHVQTLRALEGEWHFEALRIEGFDKPAAEFAGARLLIDGDRFRMESIEGTYEGEFNIDVAAQPMQIDIHFVEGPEAGNVCEGVFVLDGDSVQYCLSLGTAARPLAFAAEPGSGHVLERLRRADARRPQGVDGGTAPTLIKDTAFESLPSAMYERLGGNWQAITAMRDGQAMPEQALKTFVRTGEGARTRVCLGQQVMIDARISIDESHTPMQIDYCYADGRRQFGILVWDGEEVSFCSAPPGKERPHQLESPKGSGNTLSRWRRMA